jgi:hypothetical protein
MANFLISFNRNTEIKLKKNESTLTAAETRIEKLNKDLGFLTREN